MPEEYRSDPIGTVGTESDATVDLGAAIASGAVAGEPARQRKRRSDAGQPRGSRGTAAKEKTVSLDLSSLEGLFVGIHALLADRTKTPELAITDDESKAFMKACSNVARHYGVQASQKAVDHMALMGIIGSMYGSRVILIRLRKESEKNQSQQTANVIQIHPNGAFP